MKRQSNNIPQQAFCRSSAVVLPAMKFVQKTLLPFTRSGWRHKKRQPKRVARKSLINDQLQQDPSIRHLRGGGELSKENNNIRKQVSIQILIVIRGSAITKRALNDAARFVQFSLLQNGHFQIKNTHDALLPIAFELKVRKTRSV